MQMSRKKTGFFRERRISLEALKAAVKVEMDRMADNEVVYENLSQHKYSYQYDVVVKVSDYRYRIYSGHKFNNTENIDVESITVNHGMLKAMGLR